MPSEGELWHRASGRATSRLAWFPFPCGCSAPRAAKPSASICLHKEDHSRIRQVTYCQAEDKPVPRSELVKGYEYEKDHYVEIDDEDIKKVAPKTAKVMEILEFVKAEQVDPIYLESSYYVAPDEGGEKPYALLFQALRESTVLRAGQGGHAQPRAHHRAAAGRQGHPLPHHVLPGRDPPGGRIPHRYQPGEGKGAGHGEDADLVAGGRFRAAEIPRRVPRQPAEDDRGQDRRAQSGGRAAASTWLR